MTRMWRNSAATMAIIGILLQAAGPAFADDVGVPIHPLPSNSSADRNSTASKSFDWNIRTFDPHDAATAQFSRGPLGATSGAEPGSASGREGSENRFDPLALLLGVVIMGIIGAAILNTDNSGSPV